MATLPYVTAPGNVEEALKGIKSAATPPSVNQDFVKTILKIPGGSGNEMTAYLRKIGFASSEGAPTESYKKFRNQASEGQAAAEALKFGYKALYVRNEYMHELTDDKLKGLIIEETGEEQDSRVVGMIMSCIKALKKYAKWTQDVVEEKPENPEKSQLPAPTAQDSPARPDQIGRTLGMNLSYTINLNLPPTTDVAVFNAIFKSLKEHLLKGSNGCSERLRPLLRHVRLPYHRGVEEHRAAVRRSARAPARIEGRECRRGLPSVRANGAD
jgi:hypothetical protein